MGKVTRIAFAADLHVDAYGSRIDPATGLNARLVDYLASVRRVAAEATERGCDALVIAGDFTDRRHPAPWLVSQVREALEAGPKVQVYLRGNHDGEIAGGSIVSVLADGRNRIGVSRPSIVKVGTSARDMVALCCVPHLDRHWLRAQPGLEHVPDADVFRILGEQLLAVAAGLYAEAKGAGIGATVLVLHQTLAGAAMSESQQAFLGDLGLVVDARALAAIGFEAIVAGHLHRHQVLEGTPVPVLYPGSIERVDFGEEHEPKGFVVADVGPGRFEWEFVELPARWFVTIGPRDLDPIDVAGAIVRCVDVPPEVDTAALRRDLEADGAFEVVEIRRRPVEAPEIAGGLSETLSPADALAAYFDGEPDRDELCELGRELLTEAAV